MSFELISNSAGCVVTGINSSTNPNALTITSGSFPLYSGSTISGTNTEITYNYYTFFGNPYGSVSVFLNGGSSQIEVYVNNVLFSSGDYSSGEAVLRVPNLSSSDSLRIVLDDTLAPYPTPTPSNTPSVTSTPTPTITQTPTNTNTPTNTSTPTPTPSGASLKYPSYAQFYAADAVTNITAITGNIWWNGFLLSGGTDVYTDYDIAFYGNAQSLISTGSTYPTIVLSASPSSGFVFADDGVAGMYDNQLLSGFT